MGVGRGVKIGDVKESATSRRLSGKMLGNRRRPKKWYSKTFHAEVMKLSEIFAKEYGQTDLNECRDALEVNGVSPVLFAEAFAGKMQQAGRGTIALIGSVAGDRGRKSNYAYGAAKGMVTRYAQGLQHRLAASKVKIVLIKPGPTATPMTAKLSSQGVAMASVEAVAQSIVTGIDAGKPVIYAPAKWALIMMIIRHLPRFVFNKMNI
jgi:short-subunit dehydrogenase